MTPAEHRRIYPGYADAPGRDRYPITYSELLSERVMRFSDAVRAFRNAPPKELVVWATYLELTQRCWDLYWDLHRRLPLGDPRRVSLRLLAETANLISPEPHPETPEEWMLLFGRTP